VHLIDSLVLYIVLSRSDGLPRCIVHRLSTLLLLHYNLQNDDQRPQLDSVKLATEMCEPLKVILDHQIWSTTPTSMS